MWPDQDFFLDTGILQADLGYQPVALYAVHPKSLKVETLHSDLEPKTHETLLLCPLNSSVRVLDVNHEVGGFLYLHHRYPGTDPVGHSGPDYVNFSRMYLDPIESADLRRLILQPSHVAKRYFRHPSPKIQKDMWRFRLLFPPSQDDPSFCSSQFRAKMLANKRPRGVSLDWQPTSGI